MSFKLEVGRAIHAFMSDRDLDPSLDRDNCPSESTPLAWHVVVTLNPFNQSDSALDSVLT
jgi:hypothetical protein